MCDDSFSTDAESLLLHVRDEHLESNDLEDEATRSKSATSTPKSKYKQSSRFSHFLKCIEHHSQKEWSTHVNGNCPNCILFTKVDSFPSGKLPNKHEVISYLLTRSEENFQGGHNSVTLNDTASKLALHWIYCNVYPQSVTCIRKKLKEAKEEYQKFRKVSQNKRGKTYFIKLKNFIESCNSLFDIIGNSQQIKKQEHVWKVKMTEEDYSFHKSQSLYPRIGYCTNFVCRKSEIKDMERTEREDRVSKQKEKAINYKKLMEPVSSISLESEESGSDDEDFKPEPPEKKRRYEYQQIQSDCSDDMPHRFRHVRHGLRSVRPEIYEAAHILNSKYHLSRNQIEGAFIEIGRVFGRDWKPFEANNIIDDDTLPSMTNIIRTRNYAEAMALNFIIEEVMSCNKSSITYSNDGSSMSKVGSYVVQSITVNGTQRALPALSIVTESHNTLKELELATLEILSASCGYKYSKSDIVKKIDFVMTDSTAHNIGVIEKVCEDLNIEDPALCPKTLLCNIHPLMLFQNKLKELYNDIQLSFGFKRLDECFTVDVDFKNENFVLKAIKCLSNFVNEENSARPWNRFSHFTQFIAPKKNETISLKDHRFNRLNDCSLVILYHFDDIAEYLLKFESITNNIAILDRSFIDIGDVLKPIFCATAVLGYHITRPFHRLLVDVKTSYDTLFTAFPKLFQEFSMDPKELLTPEQVFHFVPSDIFKDSLAKDYLINSLFSYAQEYETEVLKIIKLCLDKFRKGFELQKGAIFGFGTTAENDTGSVLKLSSLQDKSILTDTPVHNLGEERNVGMLNCELNLRGRKRFTTSSQNLVLNKSTDLIQNKFDKVNQFRSQAKEIKDIREQWSHRMEEIDKAGMTTKEAASLTQEQKKLKDLEFLKSQQPPGPFSSAEEVDKFMLEERDELEKNARLYREIRYAKLSTSSMKRASDVFRLKKDHKTLQSEDYAHNLKAYFGCIHSVKVISLEDFSVILTGLNAARSNIDVNSTKSQNSSSVKLQAGEHVAGVWSDEKDPTGQTLTWHIGVIESIDAESITISYLVSNSKDRCHWVYPETATTLCTPKEQIIATGLSVEYSCATIIRCKITKETVIELNDLLSSYIEKL